MYMQISTQKTNAWIKETPNSKKNKGIKIKSGTRWKTKKINSFPIKINENPIITFNNVCPAIIFANKRIDKLIGLNT